MDFFSKCWLFVTNGLCMNAQDEIVFILKCSTDEVGNVNETKIPRQILYHIMDIFDKSLKGLRVGPMNHLLYDFDSAKIATDILNTNNKTDEYSSSTNEIHSSQQTDVLFENKENAGFFYFRPTTFHKDSILDALKSHLPDEPYLISYLIHRWEIPWAKLFPLRLYLRLCEQFDCKLFNFSLIEKLIFNFCIRL